jgi:hypothetical protein
MSVTVRPCVNGGWEVDIRVQLPDGTVSPAALDAAIRLLETGTELSRVAVEKSWRRRENRGRGLRQSERLACQP